jgi:hypothetical protein
MLQIQVAIPTIPITGPIIVLGLASGSASRP